MNINRQQFTHKSIGEEVILSARNTDNCIKTNRKLDYNFLQNVKTCNIEIGDDVLVKKYKKSIKYDHFYLQEKFLVADILPKGIVFLVKDPNSSIYLKRHPNDLKRVKKDITFNVEKNQKGEYDNELGKAAFDHISQNIECNDEINSEFPAKT